MKRQVSECQFRDHATSGQKDATCRLLHEITGVSDESCLTVSQEVCEACCDAFVPTRTDWNPVIASRVFQIATEASEKGGLPGCDLAAAESLTLQVIEQLPVVNSDEDDCEDDLQDFVPPVNATLDDLHRVLPTPKSSQTGEPIRWAVGVTTAPRRQSTLVQCVDSIVASGWDMPSLFVDGPVEIETSLRDACRKSRPESIGAWPTWCDTVESLLETDADVIMVVQDDTLFPCVSALRTYVESMLWPTDDIDKNPCIVSLYTSTDDMQPGCLWRKLPDRWQYGALAFVFPAALAEDIVEMNRHGELDVVEGTAGIDTRIGVWAQRRGVSVWHPSPSVVQHIGQVSSIWATSRAVGLRRADRFIANEL